MFQRVWVSTKSTLVCLLLASVQLSSAHGEEISDGVSTLSLADAKSEFGVVPASVRAGMNRDQVARFFTNVLVDRRLAAAAEKAGIATDERVKVAIAKATQDVVIRAYIEAEMDKFAANLPDLTGVAKERFERDQSSYLRPEAIRVAHILLKVIPDSPDYTEANAKARADKILAELKNGADFSDLAKANSDDRGSAGRGGVLPGWSDKGRLVPQFEEVAYAMKPGQISDLVRTRFGYHIIKLLEHRDRATPSFDEVKGQLLTKVRDDLLASKREEFLRGFSGLKPVTINDEVLQMLKK